MVGQTAVATIEARRQRRLDEYRSARTDRSHNVELSAEGETERTASSAGGESARTAEGETATPAQLEEELPGLQALFEDPPAPEVQGQSGRRYHSTSLCWLRPSDQPRCAAILLVEARWFDPFILTIILANCATMAWESPLDPPGTWKAGVLDLTEWFFLYIFTTELVAKVIAYGFVMHEGSYLQDPWCQLDFVVVSCAWLPLLFPSMGNYSVLRALRALRPLRSLRLVPGMAVLISSIISTVPKLANVLALCGFIFLVFGIVGMELFKGTLHYRCALPGFEELPGHPRPERSLAEVVPLGSTLDAALVTALDEAGFAPRPLLGVLHPARARSLEGLADQTVTPASAAAAGALLAVAQLHPLFLPVLRRLRIIEPYKSSGETSEGGGKPVESSGDPDEAAIDAQETFDTGEACNPQLQHHPQCAPGAKCRYFAQAPFAGLMSFDNIGVACIVILQTITFDTWTEAMYALMSAFSPSACIFFVLIVVLGGFFVINLFLAVILQEVLAAHSVEAAPAQHACAHHDALTSPQVRETMQSHIDEQAIELKTARAIEENFAALAAKLGCIDEEGQLMRSRLEMLTMELVQARASEQQYQEWLADVKTMMASGKEDGLAMALAQNMMECRKKDELLQNQERELKRLRLLSRDGRKADPTMMAHHATGAVMGMEPAPTKENPLFTQSYKPAALVSGIGGSLGVPAAIGDGGPAPQARPPAGSAVHAVARPRMPGRVNAPRPVVPR